MRCSGQQNPGAIECGSGGPILVCLLNQYRERRCGCRGVRTGDAVSLQAEAEAESDGMLERLGLLTRVTAGVPNALGPDSAGVEVEVLCGLLDDLVALGEGCSHVFGHGPRAA